VREGGLGGVEWFGGDARRGLFEGSGGGQGSGGSEGDWHGDGLSHDQQKVVVWRSMDIPSTRCSNSERVYTLQARSERAVARAWSCTLCRGEPDGDRPLDCRELEEVFENGQASSPGPPYTSL